MPSGDQESNEKKEKQKDGNGNSNSNRHQNRFHSPPVELPSSNAQNFYEEAKITHVEENELRRKFGKFCTKAGMRGNVDDEPYLALDDFCRMLQYYECASAQHYEAYFHAIDRNHDDKLDFQEFFLGCCAADPSTVHILNSFTGYERSQYIFDFYDTNRSQSLEFDEFARLTADCLSLPSTNPHDEQVKRQAIEKARDLGAVEESSGSTLHFMCIKFKKFYEFIQNERLRGTSRLFRFSKSIIKSRGSHHGRRAQGSSGNTGNSQNAASGDRGSSGTTPTTATPTHGSSGGGTGQTPTTSHGAGHAADDADEDPPSGREDCEWHAHLLDLDRVFDPDGDEPESFASPTELDRSRASLPPPYAQLPPPAPAASLRLESDPPSATDARTIARKVLRTLSSSHFDGLLNGATGFVNSDAQFSLVAPAQLRALCNAAVRLMEPEDMVLTGLQPPVKVFGGIHGQLLDLLSHFKWQQAPVEDIGDILYTTYVFLGDYADRGGFGLEVLTLLLSLKVAHPHRVALLRGHHESRHLNYHLGLKAECERRLGPLEGMKVFEHINRVFEHMSLAAIINGQILALGPGVLPTSLARLDQLRRYKKPLVLPHVSQPRAAQPLDRLNEQVLLELFTPNLLMPREFGAVREATPEQVKHFCSQHKLAAIIRSRQVPSKGFSFDCGGRFITVNSCVNYIDLPRGNDAAILSITKEEQAPNIYIRPKVLTAQVAKIHRVLGKGFDSCDGAPMLLPARWPAQSRDATPGRVSRAAILDDLSSEQQAAGDAATLVVHADRTITPDASAAMDVFPAFGPGRPPGGLVRREGRGSTKGADSPHLRSRGAGDADGQEDWALLTASASGRSSLPDRRSLGSRRGSGPKGQDSSKTRSGGPSSGKTFADPIVTQVLRQSDDAEAGPTPKGVSPDNRSAPRTPGGGSGNATVSSGASPTNSGGKSSAAAEASGQRRGGAAPADGARLSLSSTQGARGELAVVGGTSPTAGSGASTSRESKTMPAGGTATGGRNTPQSGGVPSSSQGPRKDGSSGKQKDAPQALRGSSSRPPGAAPSPKASTPSSKGGGSGGGRRGTGELGRGDASASGPDGDHGGAIADAQALSRLLQEHSKPLAASSMPAAPSSCAQLPRTPEQPLVYHLCKLWGEAGLGDKEWAQALHMFETELNDQLRQTKGGSNNSSEPREGRWTLETFSMWLLKRGRRLRECSQWFRAFDFDHDDMIGIADFIQGLVAAGSSRMPSSPSSACGLCTANALFRLLDLEKRQSIDVMELESILGDAQVSVGADFPFSIQQTAQRATDFDFFRSSLLPRLQGAPAFRLRVFGPPPPE